MNFDANALANATAPTGEYGDKVPPPPVGTYEVVVDAAEAFPTEAKGDFVKFDLRVATGEQAGHAWTELFSFKTSKAYDFFLGVCNRLHINLDGVTGLTGPSSLDERVKTVVGNWYVIDVVASKNPQFPNNSVFFKDGGPIPTGDTPAATGGFDPVPAGSAGDPDIPF